MTFYDFFLLILGFDASLYFSLKSSFSTNLPEWVNLSEPFWGEKTNEFFLDKGPIVSEENGSLQKKNVITTIISKPI